MTEKRSEEKRDKGHIQNKKVKERKLRKLRYKVALRMKRKKCRANMNRHKKIKVLV